MTSALMKASKVQNPTLYVFIPPCRQDGYWEQQMSQQRMQRLQRWCFTEGWCSKLQCASEAGKLRQGAEEGGREGRGVPRAYPMPDVTCLHIPSYCGKSLTDCKLMTLPLIIISVKEVRESPCIKPSSWHSQSGLWQHPLHPCATPATLTFSWTSKARTPGVVTIQLMPDGGSIHRVLPNIGSDG